MVEVNAETDFVARNETFQDFVAEVANVALTVGDDLEAIKAAPYPGTGRDRGRPTDAAGRHDRREHERSAAPSVLAAPNGVVATYVHSALKPGLGKIGVLVAVEGEQRNGALETLGRQVGMHVAAAAARGAGHRRASIRRRWSARRRCCREQARASGKPEAIIAQMVEGRIRKYYEEVVLLEQVWVHDGESRVRAVRAEGRREAGRLRALPAWARASRRTSGRLRRRGGGGRRAAACAAP